MGEVLAASGARRDSRTSVAASGARRDSRTSVDSRTGVDSLAEKPVTGLSVAELIAVVQDAVGSDYRVRQSPVLRSEIEEIFRGTAAQAA